MERVGEHSNEEFGAAVLVRRHSDEWRGNQSDAHRRIRTRKPSGPRKNQQAPYHDSALRRAASVAEAFQIRMMTPRASFPVARAIAATYTAICRRYCASPSAASSRSVL